MEDKLIGQKVNRLKGLKPFNLLSFLPIRLLTFLPFHLFTFVLLTTYRLPLAHADLIIESGASLGVEQGAVLDSSGSVIINSGGTLTSSGTVRLTKNWNNAGTFAYNSSTVAFYDVMNSSITGNTTFHVLIATEAGKTIQFEQNSTQTVRNIFNFGGTSGNEVKLRSTTDGTGWYLSLLTGNITLNYVDVKDGQASGATITCNNSIDSGNNNANWIFPAPDIPVGGMLTNPGFETGDTTGWTDTVTTANPGTVTSPVYAGTYAGRIFPNNTGGKSIAQNPSGITVGTTYYMAGFFQLTESIGAGTGRGLGLHITTGNATGGTAFGGASSMTLSAPDWMFLSVTTIAAYTAIRAHVRISDGASPFATGYIDNIYFNLDTPPDAVSNLTALPGDNHGEIKLRWTSPGADGTQGPYKGSFIVKYTSAAPISDFNNPGTGVSTITISTSVFNPTRLHTEVITPPLAKGATWYFAVAAFDGLFSTGTWSLTGVNSLSSSTVRDLMSPNAISDLTALPGSADGEINLRWTAPGDDGTSHTLLGSFTIKYSSIGIINESQFNAPPAALFVTTVTVSTSGVSPGVSVGRSFSGLNSATRYWFAIKYQDSAGNLSVWKSSQDASSFNNLLSTESQALPNAPSSLAQYTGNFVSLSSSTWTTYRQVRATFTLSDPNGSDTLQFNIQFSTNSDFSYLFINSTSASGIAQGATNFINSTLLPDGTWYWRVKANDNNGGSSAYSSMNSGAIAFRIDATTPASVTPTVTRSSNGAVAMNLSWSVVTDTTSGIIGYRIYRVTATTISNTDKVAANLIASTSTLSGSATTYTDSAVALSANTTYTYAVCAVDAAGNEADVSGAALRTARIEIDGDFSDWNTAATSSMFDNSGSVDNSVDGREFIWKDKVFERRSDPVVNLGNYDLYAVHAKADEEFIYFLIRYDDLTAFNGTFYFAISIDTDSVSNQSYGNWNADDSGMGLGNGGDAYPETAGAGGFFNRAEKQIIVHSTAANAVGPQIELYSPPAGGTWYSPSEPGSGANYVVISNGSGGNDGIEFKVARADLGLTGNKIARISVATYKPVLGWANNVDTTENFTAGDALDSMSIVRVSTGSSSAQYYNDAAHNMSSWDEDISDSDIDFWVDIPLVGNGLEANSAPSVPTLMTPLNDSSTNTFRPTLSWSGASDSDSGDAITSYLVEFATWSSWPSNPQANISGSGAYGFRVNVVTNNWQIPTDLADFTTYYWRVWPRDRKGALSGTPTLWKFWVQSDTIAPSAITNLVAIAGDINSNENYRKITLQWTAPGDDNLTGNLTGQFEIRYLIGNTAITSESDWNNASGNSILITTTNAGVSSWAPGVTISSVITLTPGTTYNFAIKAADEAQNSQGTRMNWSALDTTTVEPSTRAPGTYHNLNASDGDLSDWDTTTEMAGLRQNASFYFTWSSTAVYFAYRPAKFGGAGSDADFIVMIDTHASFSINLGSGSPPAAPSLNGIEAHQLPFKADYALVVEGGGTEYTALQNWTGSAWNNPGDGGGIAQEYIGWSGNETTEIAILRSTLNNPTKVWLMAFHKWETQKNVYNSFPTQNPAPNTDTAVTFSYFWELNLSSRQFPAEARLLVNQNPRAISDLTALTGSADGDINLTWTAPANEDGSNITDGTYSLKYATTQITSSNFDTVPLAQTQTISTNTVAGQSVGRLITGLNPGTTYYFGLKINNGANSSVWNVSGSVNSRSSAPAADFALSAPTNVSALGGDVSSTTIRIRWINPSAPTYVDDRSSYTLYAATSNFSSANNSWVIRSSEVPHPLSFATSQQMTPNTTYFFAVTAIDSGTVIAGLYSAALESVLSSPIYSTPTLAAIPPPQAFVPADVGESSITFRWLSGGNPTATLYQAQVSTEDGFTSATTSDTFTLSVSSINLSANTTYYFRVRARNHSNLYTDWSQTVSTKTLAGDTSAPIAITDLAAAQGSSGGEINITWSAPGDDGHIGNITGGKYRIDYSTDANRNFVVTNYQIELSSNINQGEKHGRVLTGLSQGATYYIRVYTADEIPNWSAVSNGATQWATRAGGGDGTEAMMVYFSSSPTNSDPTRPGYRTFDSFQWATVGFAQSGGKEASGFQIVRAKPNSNERVAGWQTNDGGVKLAVFNGSSWGNFHSVSNETIMAGQRKFDLAYEEGGGGEAIVVFRSSGANQNTPFFTRWNGTSWTAPTSISGWTLSAAVQWIRLVPKPNSDEIVAVAMQDSTLKRITAMVWNGSSWGNYKNLTEDLASSIGATASTTEGFDVTYQSNGTGFVVWGTTSSAIYIATFTTSGGWTATAVSSAPAQVTGSGTSALRWVKASRRAKSNEILIAAAEGTPTSGSADLHIWVWNGSQLSAYNEVDTDIQAESGAMGTRHFDVAYERSSREGMALWADDSSPVKYRVITGTTIGSQQNGPAWPNSVQISWLSLTQDQTANSDKLYLLMGSSNGVLSYARWDGSSWEATQTFESYGNAGSPSAEWFALASRWVAPEGVDNIAPGAISDLTALQAGENRISLQWTAPGDDQQSGNLPANSLFRIKYSSVGIINSADFESPPAVLAVKTIELSTSATVGSKQGTLITGLMDGVTYWFAIKTRDNAENWSIWKSSADDNNFNTLAWNWAPFDATPPAAITNLTATPVDFWSGRTRLQWTAPTEDGASGGAVTYYIVKYATQDFALADWDSSWVGQVISTPTPSTPGATETMDILGLGVATYYFHIRSVDDRGNTSALDTTATPAQVYVQHILISEVMLSSGSGAANLLIEFVELYNPTTNWFNLQSLGLELHLRSGTGANTRKLGSGGVGTWLKSYIPPRGFFLVASSSYNTVYGNADATYSDSGQQLVANGAVWISTTNAAVSVSSVAIDLVGFGSQPSPNFEGTAVTNPADKGSVERRAAGGANPTSSNGNAYDLNNNATDFVQRTAVEPQNSNSSPEPDNAAPSAVTDLTAQTGTSTGTIVLTWTAPGDDNTVGTATNYIIKMATSSELSPALSDTNFNNAQNVNSTSPVPSPLPAGTSKQFMLVTGLMQGVSYYFAIKAQDEVGNISSLSNGATAEAQTTILSVSVDIAEIDFGTFTAVQNSTRSQVAVVVMNNGNVPQRYLLKATTATAGTPWTLGNARGNDQIVLNALFNSSEAADTNFESVVSTVTFANQAAGGAGGNFAGDQTGTAVPADATRNLWFRLMLPLSTSVTGQQLIQVTITAEQSP